MLGKIIGGLMGHFLLSPVIGPFGAISGVVVGHVFDLGRKQLNANFDPAERARVEHAFTHALFPVLGCLAKADGHVSDDEIKTTEELITRMGLNASARKEAIALFQKGKDDEFDLDASLAEFQSVCARHVDLKRVFLGYLITLALADGVLDPNEEKVLERVSDKIGFSRFAFNQLIGMVRAQMAFRQRKEGPSGYSYYRESHGHQGGQSYYATRDELALAYEALGVSASDSDAVIKKTYRKLMSENHPDKLSGQGVPEDMIKLATERSQEIQSAYDTIKKSRKA